MTIKIYETETILNYIHLSIKTDWTGTFSTEILLERLGISIKTDAQTIIVWRFN